MKNKEGEKEITNNGTPYTDEQWKAWYTNHTSSDELSNNSEYIEDELANI